MVSHFLSTRYVAKVISQFSNYSMLNHILVETPSSVPTAVP